MSSEIRLCSVWSWQHYIFSVHLAIPLSNFSEFSVTFLPSPVVENFSPLLVQFAVMRSCISYGNQGRLRFQHWYVEILKAGAHLVQYSYFKLFELSQQILAILRICYALISMRGAAKIINYLLSLKTALSLVITQQPTQFKQWQFSTDITHTFLFKVRCLSESRETLRRF